MLHVRLPIGKAKASRPLEGFIPNPKLKLLDQVSEVMRFSDASLRRRYATQPVCSRRSSVD